MSFFSPTASVSPDLEKGETNKHPEYHKGPFYCLTERMFGISYSPCACPSHSFIAPMSAFQHMKHVCFRHKPRSSLFSWLSNGRKAIVQCHPKRPGMIQSFFWMAWRKASAVLFCFVEIPGNRDSGTGINWQKLLSNQNVLGPAWIWVSLTKRCPWRTATQTCSRRAWFRIWNGASWQEERRCSKHWFQLHTSMTGLSVSKKNLLWWRLHTFYRCSNKKHALRWQWNLAAVFLLLKECN